MKKLIRKSMIIFSMLVGAYFIAGDSQSVSANPGCYQGCSVNYSLCQIDYACNDNPNNPGCNFCENRLAVCMTNCQLGRPGSVPR